VRYRTIVFRKFKYSLESRRLIKRAIFGSYIFIDVEGNSSILYSLVKHDPANKSFFLLDLHFFYDGFSANQVKN
jgi:hypothetical protein